MNAVLHTWTVFAQLRADRPERPIKPGRVMDPMLARQLQRFLWTALTFAALYVLLGHMAWAADASVGGESASFALFDSLVTQTEGQSRSWFSTILGLVRPTFLILATIEICWAAAIWAFEKDNLNSLAVEIIKKIMFIGFFYALLQYAPEWIPTIVDSFKNAGEAAAGTKEVTTDYIIALGLATIKLVWSKAPTGLFAILGALGKIIVACFVTIGIVIAFVVVAAQFFTLKIESYILFAAGAIFLGLGSSSWTKDYVSKYLNYAINVGIRLLVLILILSMTLKTINDMAGGFQFEYDKLLEMLAVSILQSILAIKAPEMAGALLNGGAGLSAGSAMGAGASAMGNMKMAATMAAGAATGGAAAAAGALKAAAGAGLSTAQGAKNIGGALKAGTQLAKQDGKSGAAAAVGGLNKAIGQAGTDVKQKVTDAAKALPSKLANAVKGKGEGERGNNPGLFDRTKQKLQEELQKNQSGSDAGSDIASLSSAAANSSLGTLSDSSKSGPGSGPSLGQPDSTTPAKDGDKSASLTASSNGPASLGDSSPSGHSSSGSGFKQASTTTSPASNTPKQSGGGGSPVKPTGNPRPTLKGATNGQKLPTPPKI
ncbi:P-type conjugative transfer protein TrbL [Chitinivorax sp. B]|uniref:P-type conjugative transfer protein TrbL n=1 Tax=Chitinivorax sp. B TaxID=2502235 RepID=UPI0010F4618F|nr:P-type conjugative transfer protein TrbL [Chitinivorax sp. B]